MDWDAKMPSWDLGTVVGGGALDLKLGGPTSWRAAAAATPVPVPLPPPGKRPRGGQEQHAAAACSVEGCAADLSRSREYHRRHKVCEAHSKTAVVAVAGQQQRFCQQCSRFHLLGEFDEVKRSCRKRLDGHNRRRRKPQPDPLNPAGMFANHHGVPRFASFPQIFSPQSQSMADHSWGGIAVKTEADVFHENYYLNGGATFFHGKDTKRFPFMSNHGGGDTAAFGRCQPFTITPSSESSSNSSSSKMFAHDGGPDNCALSLLSDNPTTAQMIHYNGSVAARLPNDGDVRHSATAVTTNAAAASAATEQLQYHGYYHQLNADHGNSDDAGAMQALPFSSW